MSCNLSDLRRSLGTSLGVASILFCLLIVVPGCGGKPPLDEPTDLEHASDLDHGPWDILITGAMVLDGTGSPAFPGHLAIRDGRIVRVSREALSARGEEKVIEAQGLFIAPGFIDLHAHLEPLLDYPSAESHLRQGVTLAVGGPDGSSPWPLGPYMAEAESMGLGINVAFLAGHNTLRRAVMGLDDRSPTADELERMRALVAQGMAEGAFGISTGLRYTPGAFSELGELVELARVAAESGGIYTSHLRDEGMELMDGVREALEIGRQASIPIVLTHHKVVGAPMWGSSELSLALVDSARAAGTDVMLDQYPYTGTHTGISILLPPWSLAGGDEAFLSRLDEPVLRDSIYSGLVWNLVNDRGGNDLSRVQFSRVEWDPSLEGQTLRDWAERQGLEPTIEVGADLVVEAMRRGGANAIFHALHEEDVERIMRHPFTAIASDGRLTRLGEGHPHPRAYGTFPRVLGHYVRERGVLRLEEAVRKMTSLPASRLGLTDRGRIESGARADLVLFDPERIIDRATFEDPHQYPEGIEYVLVNGVVVLDRDGLTSERPGRVLRRPGSESPRSN